ncbi:hypothetical protein [Burkholderia latens]|uniref:hypothetical protein n=1 Tax=Burkholderia latens TaxID=488446 RepID=UPI001FD81234|nr:hypothetical protein [Burkholderia latens]
MVQRKQPADRALRAAEMETNRARVAVDQTRRKIPECFRYRRRHNQNIVFIEWDWFEIGFKWNPEDSLKKSSGEYQDRRGWQVNCYFYFEFWFAGDSI